MATVVASPRGPAMDPSNITATHPFTCNTCQVAFRGSEAQKEHMRSDWHRYNLKRRVATLPPASAETFSKLVLSKQASQMEAARKATFEQSCHACQKVYKSENAFQEHLYTQRHRQKEALYRKTHRDENNSVATGAVSAGTFSLGDTASVAYDMAKVTSDMKEATIEENDEGKQAHVNVEMKDTKSAVDPDYPLTHCLFCNEVSNSLEANLEHMSTVHGMFVPEKKYLVDPQGLLKYLYAKINENFECIYCHKLKHSAEAIQTHMRDKGHCMIAFDTEDEMLEIGQFYDFSSTYSDAEDADGDVEVVDADAADQDGWETDGDEYLDDDVPLQSVYATEVELRLPTGRLAGHRSLARYYRQNLRNYPTQEERIQKQRLLEESPGEANERSNKDPHSRAIISRANGGLGMLHASDTQRKEVAAAEKRQRNRENRVQRQYQWCVEKRANNQKHFRDPLLQ
ncbi:hypothetical protein KEM54_005954 [Ascosphaera aggregata]|nr:hypothetical protein KEM54_005954 [Ascosphaera aggregata]